jgi:hypothetical protein
VPNKFVIFPQSSSIQTISGIALADFLKTMNYGRQSEQKSTRQEICESTTSRTALPGNEEKESFRKFQEQREKRVKI